MKKFFLFVVLLTITISGFAQKDVTKFLGIPVDGSKSEMIQKLKEKGFEGFVSADLGEVLMGEFNGRKVLIGIITNNNKVYRIALMDEQSVDEINIKNRFNTLCYQFYNNSKYTSTNDYTISEDEDISYEMSVHKKRYEAVFYQKPELTSSWDSRVNKSVWFMIFQDSGEYRIFLYYDNKYNKANGEDL